MFEWKRGVSPKPFLVAALLVASANDSSANAPTGRYTISNGTVLDNKTQLYWEQNPEDVQYTWSDAKAHCQSKGTDWRLPSMKELQTIVDDSLVDPSIDMTAFPNTALAKYWTSSPRAANPSEAWLVSFEYGGTSTDTSGSLYRVRCVR